MCHVFTFFLSFFNRAEKPMSVMRFNGALNVDMGKWTNLKMIRDDHANRAKVHDFKFDEPDMPK